MDPNGGQREILPQERQKASFEVEKMVNVLDGGQKYTLKRRWINDAHSGVESFVHGEKTREELIGHAIKHFMEVHKPHLERGYIPKDMDMQFMSDARMTSSALTINFGVFSSTLRSQSSDEQKRWWLEAAQKGKLIGAYAQSELGHATFVRGLGTTATYDPTTQEWVLNTPTVAASKWWITSLPCATHATVFAQAIVNGKNHGLQIFMVQLRGEDLKPLPGIDIWDLGATIGEKDATIGGCSFNNVRIPLRHLLEKRQHCTPEGEFKSGPFPGSMDPVKKSKKETGKVDPKMAQALKYVTMMKTRIALASTAAGALAKASTIAARYSCVRKQGFVSRGLDTEETAIIDYSVQRFRVLKWTATAYAFKAATQWMVKRRREIESAGGGEVNLDDLPETHATGAGLKAYCTVAAADGIEDLRRACGGHGFLESSGIAPLEADFKGPNTTAEGDFVVLGLQTARFLMKSYKIATKGEPLSGLSSCLKPLKDPGFNPVRDGRSYLGIANKPDFFNYKDLVKLFEWRTLVAVAKTGEALDVAQTKHGMSNEVAWNANARRLYTTTMSHVKYFVISKFAAVIDTVEDLNCQKVLSKLCALYGVADILQGEQWLGLIDADDAEQAERAAATLCAELRPDCIALVDAFDIPDRVLNSTLGSYDGNAYEALYREAKRSTVNINAIDGVPSFMKQLEPYLDKSILKYANKSIPSKL